VSRLERVNDLLAENLSEIIEHDLRDPRKGLITVTSVRVSPDLKHAQVYVTTLGDETAKREMVRVLEHAAGFIRSELGRRIRLKFVPELDWQIDNSVEYAQRIDEVLRRIREEQGGAESPASGDAGAAPADDAEDDAAEDADADDDASGDEPPAEGPEESGRR